MSLRQVGIYLRGRGQEQGCVLVDETGLRGITFSTEVFFEKLNEMQKVTLCWLILTFLLTYLGLVSLTGDFPVSNGDILAANLSVFYADIRRGWYNSAIS
ncbi:hypothetical protein DGG96_17365 [Legionella qingyii]|uniref:Uncharacterized protein n=1 Tax=Legionella qingyii TaxID=2184757 RepID=A0A317U0Q2_9GAMM|nr:hypothetical protein DGG96_17365 [Legionella qingyii]